MSLLTAQPAIELIAEGTTLYPGAYCTYTPHYRWLDNSEEAIIYGIQRVRLVGVNTPEIGEDGYEEAKEFVNQTCLGEEVKLDVDDKKQYDPHYRILAVVYVMFRKNVTPTFSVNLRGVFPL